jgi:uncharacterized membrane protein
MKRNQKTRTLATAALLSAIILLFGLPMSPLYFLGFIRVDVLQATTLHVPVLIGAVIAGPLVGGILGGVFGLCSFIDGFLMYSALGFLSPGADVTGAAAAGVVALRIALLLFLTFVPRIAMGVLAARLSDALRRRMRRPLAFALTGAAGSLMNTVFFLGLLALFSGPLEAVTVFGMNEGLLAFIGIITAYHGIPEAVLAAVAVGAICTALWPQFGRSRHGEPAHKQHSE